MAWIKEDELQGQEVLDETEIWGMRYVKIADGEDTSQIEKGELVAADIEK